MIVCLGSPKACAGTNMQMDPNTGVSGRKAQLRRIKHKRWERPSLVDEWLKADLCLWWNGVRSCMRICDPGKLCIAISFNISILSFSSAWTTIPCGEESVAFGVCGSYGTLFTQQCHVRPSPPFHGHVGITRH